jgi:hypothetical protein
MLAITPSRSKTIDFFTDSITPQFLYTKNCQARAHANVV